MVAAVRVLSGIGGLRQVVGIGSVTELHIGAALRSPGNHGVMIAHVLDHRSMRHIGDSAGRNTGCAAAIHPDIAVLSIFGLPLGLRLERSDRALYVSP